MGLYPTITKKDFTMAEMASMIDQSLLPPFTTKQEMNDFLDEAIRYNFGCVCVNNVYTEFAAEKLAGTDILLATTVSFPHGILAPDAKAAEVENSCKKGAGTIDIVSNIGAIKGADWDTVYEDYAKCSEAAHKNGCTIKAILEICYLNNAQIVKACELAKKAGFEFVKTSTGFGIEGYRSQATLGAVDLMKKTVGDDMRVKASGPIADYLTAVAFINGGAHRLGTRRGVEILQGCADFAEK